MKFSPVWYVVLGLVVLFALYVLFDKDPEPNHDKIQALETGIAIADQRISQLTKDKAKLAEKIKSDSLKQANDKITYQTTIKKKDALIANLRANPIVIKVREETPEVDSLLDAMEAKDSLQTARIDTLELNLKGLYVDMAAVKFNCEEMLQAEREKNLNQYALTQEYKKQLRKERRKKKLATVLIPIVGVGMFILGSQ